MNSHQAAALPVSLLVQPQGAGADYIFFVCLFDVGESLELVGVFELDAAVASDALGSAGLVGVGFVRYFLLAKHALGLGLEPALADVGI